jgi:putative tricarboxylic transport membrane protein
MSSKPSAGIDRTDLFAGLAVVLGCGVFAWLATGYGLGTPRRMGAGGFPFALAVLGIALGAAIALRAVLAPQHQGAPVRWRRLAFVCAAFALFALAIEPLGLLLTIPAVTVLGARADPQARFGESLALGVGLALGIWLLFVELLGLGIPVLPGTR